MKLIFAGTPEFARVALQRLHAVGFDVRLVLTQPDRPAGRGMKLQALAVKQFAQAHQLPLAQPRSLRLDGKYPEDAATARQAILDAQADVMVVAAYGLILPQWVLDAMREGSIGAGSAKRGLGCLNIHASLLPRWRGAAPIHRAIEAGDAQTGITIMQMDAGLDTGDMLLTQSLPIDATDTTASLHDKLALLGGHMVVQALELAARGGLQPTAQSQAGVSYAHKIDKQEAAIDWRHSATHIERRIRAFNPLPGATAQIGCDIVKVWRAQPLEFGGPAGLAGQILQADAHGITVQCGQGALRLTELQRAGGKRMAASELWRGLNLPLGASFALPTNHAKD